MRIALICVTFLALTAQSVLSNYLVPVGQNQCGQGYPGSKILDVLGRWQFGTCGGSFPGLPGRPIGISPFPRFQRPAGSRVIVLPPNRLPSLPIIRPPCYPPCCQPCYPPQLSCVSVSLECRLRVHRYPYYPTWPGQSGIGGLPGTSILPATQPGQGLFGIPSINGLSQGGQRVRDPFFGYNDPIAPEDESGALLNKNDDVNANDPADYNSNHDAPEQPGYSALQDAPHGQV
ncbi:uncharacterized protein LOC133841968 isoform X9 [Drosophila sulfurigaster albostrigata]|uniref:uncharacterized protein LOC133841968 isoform X9 n=1 Tax=Drosophila sulfurigaster albostrigata TaxID=89887 RepID=UPI002D21B4DC|nr:uncharacterized protein LOC133841968 isoform X9 [Drosophila sulfurigaster albostrigata]